MLQDILLPITDTSGEKNAIEAAIALAAEYDAHVSMVVPLNFPLPVSGPWGASDMMVNDMIALVRSEATAKASRLRDRLGKEDVSWEVRIADAGFSEAAHALARQTRYADLSIVAAPRAGSNDGFIARGFFSAMLFESGRPVMVIPADTPIQPSIRRAVLAWTSTREAVRALNDALFMFGNGVALDVVTVNEPGMGDRADVDIGTHLARHDVRVNAVSVSSAGETVAGALLRYAEESRAQLLIAGGYGHSRLREWMLGGTTRELLETTRLPILFSH